ncbi:MAG TPA: nucleotide exchange factor GrpE [Candidatus Paceibacterota bacterium]|nr:nucleotide exchange factor GrpE [Candidatus Paceibacterota bacterium]
MDNDDVVIESDGSEELGTDVKDKSAKLKADIEQLRKEKQEYLDGWQRAKADYVNALKRFEEEKKGALELGKILSVQSFLPAMDSLDRAEAAGEIPEAFQGIAKQLHTAAKELGLEKFGAAGDTFDPALHEALGQDPTDDKNKDDTITVVLEPGWKSKELVVRPAKVRVAHFEG